MDIGRLFERGWRLFARDVAAYVIGALLVGVLSIITIGILYGPLSAGMFAIAVRRVRHNRTAEIGDVFVGFEHFWRYLAGALLLAILIGIGLIFLIVPGLLLAAIWMYTFPLMVDRNMGVFDAMSESRRLVNERGLGLHLAVVVLLGIGQWAVSSVTGGIGWLFTLPLSVTVITAMYFTATGDERSLLAAVGGRDNTVWQPAAPAGPAPEGTWQPVPPEPPVAGPGGEPPTGVAEPPVAGPGGEPPTGVAESPTGVAEPPTGVAEAPNDAGQLPSAVPPAAVPPAPPGAPQPSGPEGPKPPTPPAPPRP
jgi:hypothetical protein